MLQPKKTKHRKQQKGKIKGNAQRGHQIAFGSFGIKSLDEGFLTSRQIEAARIAVTRYMKREGKVWIRKKVSYKLPITGKELQIILKKELLKLFFENWKNIIFIYWIYIIMTIPKY